MLFNNYKTVSSNCPYVTLILLFVAALCPHIDECMSEVVTGEEDVEIGRCVTNHIHIECTHAWEVRLFFDVGFCRTKMLINKN